MASGWIVLAGVVGLALLSAAAVGPGRPRRWAAALLGAGSLLAALAARRDPPLLATVCALFSLLAPVKISQLLVDPRQWPLRARVWHVLSPFDTRETVKVGWSLDGKGLAWVAVHAAIAIAALLVGLEAEALGPVGRLVVRSLAGGVGVYSGSAAAAGLVVVSHRLAGVHVPPIHTLPIASRSIAEFWGRRWNRPVHEWLRAMFFVPLARRGRARLGVLAAFAGSAAIHAWIVLVSVGPGASAAMTAFFALQGVLVLVEDRLGVRRWPAALGHAWTLGTFALCAPLFLEPFMRALGV